MNNPNNYKNNYKNNYNNNNRNNSNYNNNNRNYGNYDNNNYTTSTTNLSYNKQWKRPEKTYTDSLQTTQAMREKLKNYERVKKLEDVPLNTHVRYVTWKNDRQRFCLGGLLKEIHPKYVKLSNGQFHWSVQRQHFNEKKDKVIFNTVFFKVIFKNTPIKNNLTDQEKEIKRLREMNAKLKKRCGIGPNEAI